LQTRHPIRSGIVFADNERGGDFREQNRLTEFLMKSKNLKLLAIAYAINDPEI